MYKRNVKDFSNCTNCVYLKVDVYGSFTSAVFKEYACGCIKLFFEFSVIISSNKSLHIIYYK